jgi:signal peptidase
MTEAESGGFEMSLKTIWNIISWAAVIIVVLLAFALVGVRIAGFTPYAIVSPSMTPKYQVGDLVYVKAVDPENIQVGDVLTFVANEDLMVVTHRVEEIDRENDCIYTKGDANNSRDLSPVSFENIVGRVEFSLPKLGYLSNYLTSTSGHFAGIAVLLFLILLFLVPEFFRPEKAAAKG